MEQSKIIDTLETYQWGNEISMNQHQVRKLIKIVSKIGPKMAIKLFVYTLSKTTTNYRMVSKNSAAIFLLPIMSCVPKALYSILPLKLHDWWA